MARRTPIGGFAAKLRLALGRANLSRAALAQQVGVDKSVVARWSSGALHPADHSLAALGAALARAIPGFDGTAWELSLDAFAARLGVAPPAPAPRAAAAPLDIALAASRDGLDQAAAAYAGVWLALYPAMGRPGELVGYVNRLRHLPGEPALCFDSTTGPSMRLHGQAIVIQVRLHILFHPAHLGDALGFVLLDGVNEEKAEVLDGISLSRTAMAERAIGAGRTMLFRLADGTDEATYAAAVARADALNREGAWEGLVTPALAAALAQPASGAPALRQVRVSPAESWAIGARGLRRPDAGPQRAALDALRAPFRGVIPGVLA